MNTKKDLRGVKGTGLLEFLIVIPLFLILVTGLLQVSRILEMKSLSRFDSLEGLIVREKCGVSPLEKELDPTLTKHSRKLAFDWGSRRGKGLLHFLPGLSEVNSQSLSIRFVPRPALGKGRGNGEIREYSEESILVSEPWDKGSRTMKALRAALLTPVVITTLRGF